MLGVLGRASQAKPETCMRRRVRPTRHHQLGTAIHDRNTIHRLYEGVCTSLLGSLHSFNDFYLNQCYVIDFKSMVVSCRFLCCRNTYSSHWSSLTAWICSDVKFIAGYVVVAWHEYMSANLLWKWIYYKLEQQQTIWAILIWSQSIWRLWNLMSALFSDLSINSVTIGCAWSMHHFSRNDIHSRALFPSLPHFLKVGKAWDHPSHEWHQVGMHWVGPILS